MVTLERELTIAAVGIRETERFIEEVDRILRPGVIRPRNDAEVAQALGMTVTQVEGICRYLQDGVIDLGLGNCPECRGWGRFGDDIFCGGCKGTGDIQ